MIDEGALLPDVTLVDAEERPLRLHDLARPLILFFFPKADTAGCTREAQEFSARADRFAAAGTAVIGISRDAPAKLRRFADRRALTVRLASDADGDVCAAFDVWGEKRLYGRSYTGVERATFLFDEAGRLSRAWRKVRVAGHADAVLEAAEARNAGACKG